MGWFEGLASRLILPYDVARRLEKQDPATAASVRAAWAQLEPIQDDSQLRERAVSWLKGLSDGYLRLSDLGHLRRQQPELAEIISSVWRELASLEQE